MSLRPLNINSGHGHVFPRPDGVKARCGGPALCKECAGDLALKMQNFPESLTDAERETVADLKQQGEIKEELPAPEQPHIGHIHVDLGESEIKLTRPSAEFLLRVLQSLAFKGSDEKLMAGAAQKELEDILIPKNRAVRRATGKSGK